MEGTNRQAKVLTFDGVRAEESLKRGRYGRTGKGKHTTIYNAHPILEWNAAEIFLYLFKHRLPINQAYRDGKARVGCVICPFSTSWDDMIAAKKYPNELKPFTDRLQSWSSVNHISDAKRFIEDKKVEDKSYRQYRFNKSSYRILRNQPQFCRSCYKSPVQDIPLAAYTLRVHCKLHQKGKMWGHSTLEKEFTILM